MARRTQFLRTAGPDVLLRTHDPNRILVIGNSILRTGTEVADRIAQQALTKRGANYADDVRRLLDAGLAVMRRCGTTSRPRVSDIVATAGLSNDAFYRYFPSKDALVAAIIEDGAERLRTYLAHQMSKDSTPDGKIRRWVAGVLSQAADDDVAITTRAVLWNSGWIGEGYLTERSTYKSPLVTMLHEPFGELGSTDPALDASLAAYATMGKLNDFLRMGIRPQPAEIDHVATFCLRAAVPESTTRNESR